MINEKDDHRALYSTKKKRTPLVGVITACKNKKDINQFPKRKEARVFREMALEARKKGITIYFFYPEGVRWNDRKIIGYEYHPKRKPSWVKKEFSFPNIVYNRIVYRSLENRASYQKILKRFDENPNIYLFNTRFLNKQEINEALVKYELSKQFVPETRLFNLKSLNELLIKYDEVFIKPKNNSTGKGIIKVVKVGTNFYHSFAENKKTKWYSNSSVELLYRRLVARNGNMNNYLIQMGIPLQKIDNSVFDLRAQAQKNGSGNWVLTGVAVRMAAPGKFVTHIPNGGKAAVLDKITDELSILQPTIKKKVNEQLHIIIENVPEILENELGINLGVLSFDIGIDTRGKLWIIEVNSKPASFDEEDIRFKHLGYLNDYFVYISSKKRD